MPTKTDAGKANDPVVESSPTPASRTLPKIVSTIERPAVPTVEETNKELYEENGLDFETGLPPVEEKEGEPSEDVLEAIVEGESPDPEAEEAPPAPPPDWSEILIDTPQRINEIPVEERGVAIAGMKAAMEARFATERATSEQTHATTLETERANAAAVVEKRIAEEQAVAKVDKMRAEEPDKYLEWEDEFPAQALRYQEIKSGVNREPAPSKGPPPEAEARMTEAAGLVNSLNESEKAELTKLRDADPSRYDANDPKVVENVRADVRKVMTRKEDPAAKAAAARQEAAEGLEKTPKPDVSRPTSSASGALTWEKLETLSSEQVQEYLSTPEGTAELEKVQNAGP